MPLLITCNQKIDTLHPVLCLGSDDNGYEKLYWVRECEKDSSERDPHLCRLQGCIKKRGYSYDGHQKVPSLYCRDRKYSHRLAQLCF